MFHVKQHKSFYFQRRQIAIFLPLLKLHNMTTFNFVDIDQEFVKLT